MTINEVVTVTDTLITKYGAPMAQGWHKFAMAKSYGFLAMMIMLVVAMVWSLVYSKVLYGRTKKDYDGDFESPPGVFSIVFLGVAIAIGIGIIVNISDLVIAMTAPDAYWIFKALTPVGR